MAFTWNIPSPADYTIGTNAADDWLAAINSHFVANSGGGSAKWEVVSYISASPRSVLLRRKSGAAGRIVIFGQQGSTANAAAVRATALASGLYIGYSKTSTSNTVDGSWLAGAPLSAADYMPAVQAWPSTVSITGHLTYAEDTCGVWLLPGGTVNGFTAAGAGELMQDTSAADISTIEGGGGWSTTAWSSGNAIFATTITVDTGYVTAAPGSVARLASANKLIFRMMSTNTSGTLDLVDPGTFKAFFFPIWMVCNTTYPADGVVGKYKQVAFGPRSIRDTTWLDSTSGIRKAFGHSYQTAVANECFWLLDVAI